MRKKRTLCIAEINEMKYKIGQHLEYIKEGFRGWDGYVESYENDRYVLKRGFAIIGGLEEKYLIPYKGKKEKEGLTFKDLVEGYNSMI